jgi:hypothetical protein
MLGHWLSVGAIENVLWAAIWEDAVLEILFDFWLTRTHAKFFQGCVLPHLIRRWRRRVTVPADMVNEVRNAFRELLSRRTQVDIIRG